MLMSACGRRMPAGQPLHVSAPECNFTACYLLNYNSKPTQTADHRALREPGYTAISKCLVLERYYRARPRETRCGAQLQLLLYNRSVSATSAENSP